jgi:pyruvate/2-oxoacid:ferredoxin oxidoreductase alpha subunit
MHEMLHWAGGGRLPIVLVNVNRAMAPPWTIYCDQNDSLSQRDTGWMQYYCESNQEVLDTILMAFKVSEEVMLPSMLNLDAFFLSHTCEPVDIPDQAMVDGFLPPYERDMKIDTSDPHTYGGLARPDSYMEFRYMMENAMHDALEVIDRVAGEFEEIFGRKYNHLEEYRCDDAEMVLVTSGTITSTARIVIDSMREQGIPVGLIKARLFRPFPVQEYRRVLSGIRKVGVVDRNLSYGASGIFYQEIKASMYNTRHRPPIFGFVAGLGGRDVTPATISEIIQFLMENDAPEEEIIWIGVKE